MNADRVHTVLRNTTNSGGRKGKPLFLYRGIPAITLPGPDDTVTVSGVWEELTDAETLRLAKDMIAAGDIQIEHIEIDCDGHIAVIDSNLRAANKVVTNVPPAVTKDVTCVTKAATEVVAVAVTKEDAPAEPVEQSKRKKRKKKKTWPSQTKTCCQDTDPKLPS